MPLGDFHFGNQFTAALGPAGGETLSSSEDLTRSTFRSSEPPGAPPSELHHLSDNAVSRVLKGPFHGVVVNAQTCSNNIEWYYVVLLYVLSCVAFYLQKWYPFHCICAVLGKLPSAIYHLSPFGLASGPPLQYQKPWSLFWPPPAKARPPKGNSQQHLLERVWIKTSHGHYYRL